MQTVFKKEDRQHILKMVKAGGQEIIDRAEEIVGTDGLVSSIDLTLYFDDSTGIPELNVHRTNLCHNALRALGYEKTEKKDSKYQGLNVNIKMTDEFTSTSEKLKQWAGNVRAVLDKKFEGVESVHNGPDYYVGSQLTIGKYTATCVKEEVYEVYGHTDYTFCFDTYIDEKMTHIEMLTKLEEWFWSYEGFDSIRKGICWTKVSGDKRGHLRVPYAGEMFGSEETQAYVPDNPDGTWKEQWPCMKVVQKRFTIRDGICEWGWLMNQMKDFDRLAIPRLFAGVNIIGHADVYCESNPYGVRPVFVIRKVHSPYDVVVTPFSNRKESE